jgi:hypothetical protein
MNGSRMTMGVSTSVAASCEAVPGETGNKLIPC